MSTAEQNLLGSKQIVRSSLLTSRLTLPLPPIIRSAVTVTRMLSSSSHGNDIDRQIFFADGETVAAAVHPISGNCDGDAVVVVVAWIDAESVRSSLSKPRQTPLLSPIIRSAVTATQMLSSSHGSTPSVRSSSLTVTLTPQPPISVSWSARRLCPLLLYGLVPRALRLTRNGRQRIR